MAQKMQKCRKTQMRTLNLNVQIEIERCKLNNAMGGKKQFKKSGIDMCD